MSTFTTPIGRIVQGSVLTPKTKDMAGKPLTTRSGEQRVEYFLALAVPKRDAQELVDQIHKQANEDFAKGEPDLPNFAWKFVDGDSTTPNRSGKRPCDKEGYPGHIVFKFSTGFAPKLYDETIQEIIDPTRIKTGDFVRVAGSVRGNDNSQYPGVYLSHSMVQFVREGDPILVGPDPHAAFGQPTNVTPRPLPPPSPPSDTPKLAASCPYTYEQLKEQGWTDDQMRKAGWMV